MVSSIQFVARQVSLNVDGSCVANPGPASYGGLLWDFDGNWIQGFIGDVGVADILKSKLVVIHEGLKLARKMNLEDILFISDSFHTATLIKNGVQGCHRYVTLIRNIIDFAKEDWGPRRVRGQKKI